MSPTMDQPRRDQSERERTKPTGRRRAQPSGFLANAPADSADSPQNPARPEHSGKYKHDAGTRHCGHAHHRGPSHPCGNSRGRT